MGRFGKTEQKKEQMTTQEMRIWELLKKKNIPISLAEPGAERKRTSEKAPATATPAPTFPFTIIITIHTVAGRSASVTTKLLKFPVR